MKREDLKKLALLGITSGALFSATGVYAEQNVDELLKGSSHTNLLAGGGCGSRGSVRGGHSCGSQGGSGCGSRGNSGRAGYSSCGGQKAQNWGNHSSGGQSGGGHRGHACGAGGCGGKSNMNGEAVMQGNVQGEKHWNGDGHSHHKQNNGEKHWDGDGHPKHKWDDLEYKTLPKSPESTMPSNDKIQGAQSQAGSRHTRTQLNGQLAMDEHDNMVPGSADILKNEDEAAPKNGHAHRRLNSYLTGDAHEDAMKSHDILDGDEMDSKENEKGHYRSHRNWSRNPIANADGGNSAAVHQNALMPNLNARGKAMYQSLSPEGKALALKMAHQECKGHNECKGLNSCKGNGHDCAGKGGCKGQSSCKFKDKNVAVKVAADKMAEKRAGMTK